MTRFVCAFALLCGIARAQSSVPAFDVVSIKPARGDEPVPFESLCENGGRFIARGAPLLWEIKWAFDLNDYQVAENFPGWLNSRGIYDIEAKPDAGVSESDCKRMVQSLFVDRFKLRMHAETKQMSAYALTSGRRGPKLSAGGMVRINGAIKQAASEREAPDGWTMARLSNYLASVRNISRPVLDRTGLHGSYGFVLSYSTGENDDRPDIFTALRQQLGLRLESIKAPIEMISIDRIEKPSEN